MVYELGLLVLADGTSEHLDHEYDINRVLHMIYEIGGHLSLLVNETLFAPLLLSIMKLYVLPSRRTILASHMMSTLALFAAKLSRRRSICVHNSIEVLYEEPLGVFLGLCWAASYSRSSKFKSNLTPRCQIFMIYHHRPQEG